MRAGAFLSGAHRKFFLSLPRRSTQHQARHMQQPCLPRREIACAHPGSNGNGLHSSEGHGHSSSGNGNGHSSNGNGNGVASNVFRGGTVAELQSWLGQHGVDITGYGRGLAKNVQDLLEEQARLESVLSIEDGTALRTVRVLSLHILNETGQVLFEDEQILPDGRSRKRQVAVSEKLVGDEGWRMAVDRAVQEELSGALPADYKVQVLEETYRRLEEMSASMSYPGLLTKYVFHRVSAKLPGLPTGPFETREPRPGGELITRWAWKDVKIVEALECSATSSTG